MYPKILHIYGPISINSYGLMIAIGFILLVYNLYNHPKRKSIISDQLFFNIITWSLLVGAIGGRMLHIIMDPECFALNWIEAFYPWEGGFSILGTILSLLIFLPIYLWIHKVKVLNFLDLVSIYAPLMQSISRIGCFLAGCCFGIEASKNNPLAVCYKNPECLAPIGVYLHPAQLYSAAASFLIFILMRYFFQASLNKVGQLTFTYLCLESSARFIADYSRAEWKPAFNLLKIINKVFFISGYQLICIFLFLVSLVGLIWFSKKTKK